MQLFEFRGRLRYHGCACCYGRSTPRGSYCVTHRSVARMEAIPSCITTPDQTCLIYWSSYIYRRCGELSRFVFKPLPHSLTAFFVSYVYIHSCCRYTFAGGRRPRASNGEPSPQFQASLDRVVRCLRCQTSFETHLACNRCRAFAAHGTSGPPSTLSLLCCIHFIE